MGNDAFKGKNRLFDHEKNFFELSPAAAVFFSSLLFINDGDTAIAVLLAVAVHEAAHLLSLFVCGCRVSALKLGVGGLCIGYSGKNGAAESPFPYLAGPLGGLLLYVLGKLCSGCLLPEWFALACRISLFLSLFNLMPVFPLDGGQAAHLLLSAFLGNNHSGRIIRAFGLCYSVFLLLSGLLLLLKDRGIGISAAGIWLFCANIFSDDL